MRSSSGLIVVDTVKPLSVGVRVYEYGGRCVVAGAAPTGWHTPGESAKTTLALTTRECQHQAVKPISGRGPSSVVKGAAWAEAKAKAAKRRAARPR